MTLALVAMDAEQTTLVFGESPLDAIPISIKLGGKVNDSIAMTVLIPKGLETHSEMFKYGLLIGLAHQECNIGRL